MSRQAQVGAFAIVALLLLFGVFYVITDLGTRFSGYRVGVHFTSAAGLTSGAIVYFSGVTAGSVTSIQLLPDNTVDVILAIDKEVDIPRDSKFLIQAPLTGSPNLLIVPPTPKPRLPGAIGPAPAPTALAMLERRVLPVDEQPLGTNTASISDLLEQGQGEIKRLDVLLADLQQREPRLLDSLQSTLASANQLTLTANQSVQRLSAQAQQIGDTMQTSLTQASANIVDLTGSLDRNVNGNSARLNHMLVQLDQSSTSLNKSTAALQEMATNRQTQAQIRDTVANLDATTQRANSLLAALGGTSNVYGVDAGATPAPPIIPGATPYPNPKPGSTISPQQRSGARAKIGRILRNLAAIQLRLSGLSSQNACCSNPILSNDRGPQADLNAILLPGSDASAMVGANDIGGPRTTWNFALLKTMGHGVRVGAGVLYSRLGVLAQYDAGAYGVEGRFYDPRHPMLDVYGNLNLAAGMRLFFGERDLTRAERRTVYGLQLQF